MTLTALSTMALRQLSVARLAWPVLLAICWDVLLLQGSTDPMDTTSMIGPPSSSSPLHHGSLLVSSPMNVERHNLWSWSWASGRAGPPATGQIPLVQKLPMFPCHNHHQQQYHQFKQKLQVQQQQHHHHQQPPQFRAASPQTNRSSVFRQQPLVMVAISRGFALGPTLTTASKRLSGPGGWWLGGRWTLIAGAVGAAVLAIRAAFGTGSEPPASWELNEIKTSIYKLMPLRLASKCWGVINNISLPSPLRAPVIGAFSWYTGCDISEAAVDDPRQYANLGEFFRRTLKPGLRPIAPGDCVVSPSDGKILHFGEVQAGFVEQVKGIAYPLQAFLGPHPWSDEGTDIVTDVHKYHEHLLKNKDGSTALYHSVVYLAPGDYHRFHSPADWRVLRRRHFPGKLLSVKPRVASWVKGLFNINERVVYSGEWKHGFFSMTAVGATNVGSIKCCFDPTLATNKLLYKKNTWCDLSFEQPVHLKKGDDFGEFNMGSTIVLIFEAPKNFEWDLHERQKIKYGERVAGMPDSAGDRKKLASSVSSSSSLSDSSSSSLDQTAPSSGS